MRDIPNLDRVRRLGSLALGVLVWAIVPTRVDASESPDWVLQGGTVIDGSGSAATRADVAIRGDRIVAVGEVEIGSGTRVMDVSGSVVAPGFIDLHTHSDRSILAPETRSNLNYLLQGVSTVVTGNCGSGPVDVGAYLGQVEAKGVGSNVIHLIPHGSLRRQVLGNADVAPDADQLQDMERLVERGMRDGAFGMSTGLIYLPGRYADTAELIALSRIVARSGGIYASHIRDEGEGLLDSIAEAIRIGRESGAPVHISHLKASGRANWGGVPRACEAIEVARAAGQIVTADQYPYTASSTSLGAMVVPHWARQGDADEFARIAEDPERGPMLREEIEHGLAERDGGSALRIARYAPKPEWVGKDLTSIAEAEGTTPLEIVLDVMRHGDAQAISFTMGEEDVRFGMARPYVATASDGSAHDPGGEDRPHPRSYGTFPRKLRYALDENVLPLEQAIRASSALPAEILGLPDRGVIRPGAFADIIIFKPEAFRDRATFDDPKRYAEGLDILFVNGVLTVMNGEYLGTLAGRALRRDRDGPADLILKVGGIWTGDPRNLHAEAAACRDGELIAVGTASEVDRFRGPLTNVVERPHAFAIPGLIDAHGHMAMLGSTVDWIDLRGVNSPEAVAKLVRERREKNPGDGWILGRNWDQSLWPGQAFPDAAILDAAVDDRPVWLVRVDGHAGWANSAALRLGRVDATTEPPRGGEIHRNDKGEPTGILIDEAMGLVTRAIPAPSKEEIARRLLAAQEMVLQAGLTGVHDAGLSRRDIEVYRELDRAGKLKVRIYGMASPPDGGEATFVSTPPESTGAESRFTLRAIKLFIDGAMGSRGALLFEPYADDPGNRGLMLIDPEVLRDTTTAALRNGWQVCTHAIGDRGNALVLDAYEAARKAVPEAIDPRLRIEHAQVVRRGDVPRFRELGVIASMQPSHASTDKRWADARLGEDGDRVAGAYAWGWFRDEGVALAFGSDFPVEVPSPFWGIYAALTRRDEAGEPEGGWHPEHRLDLETTLRAFTAGSAFAGFSENRVGTLQVGKRADITVLNRDLFRASPMEILDTRVIATVIDGEIVYEAARERASEERP